MLQTGRLSFWLFPILEKGSKHDELPSRHIIRCKTFFNNSQERLRMILFGSVEWITQTIHQLHRLGFAEVREWSPVLPSPDGEFMSILTRYRAR